VPSALVQLLQAKPQKAFGYKATTVDVTGETVLF